MLTSSCSDRQPCTRLPATWPSTCRAPQVSFVYSEVAEITLDAHTRVPVVGCGQIVYTKTENGQKKIIHTEGDSDHPISEGTLCSKGASISQLTKNDRRLKHVMYRAPGASEFVQKDWDWALKEIAKRVKKTRDESFELESGGRTVNRTEAIACLGGAALDNEEAYLLVKAMRSFGLTYIEHQARI